MTSKSNLENNLKYPNWCIKGTILDQNHINNVGDCWVACTRKKERKDMPQESTPYEVFGMIFWKQVIAMCPKTPFASFNLSATEQTEVLTQMMNILINRIGHDKRKNIKAEVKRFVVHNNRIKIRAEWYSLFGICLLYAIGRMLEPSILSVECTESWTRVYSVFMDYATPHIETGAFNTPRSTPEQLSERLNLGVTFI